MAEKKTQLSIILRTVDRATAGIKAVNDRIDEVTKPVRDLKKQLGELGEKSGFNSVAEGFKGVGDAVKETLFKFLEVGAIVGELTHLMLELVESFDDLGKKAKRIGVSADFLAGMRDAAERTGVPIQALDSGLEAFNVNLGRARAGTGRMAKFLNQVYPPLLNQLKATKDNAAAFDLLADYMAKLQDPAKRAALAQATLGDPALAETFMKGGKGLQEMRDHYIALAGPQEGAVKASEETHEAMLDLKASTDGVKAALVEGLAPALTIIIKRMTDWLQGHREDIREWAAALGQRLPDAFNAVVGAIGSVIDAIRPFVNSATKLKIVALALAAVIVGPLVEAIVTLGIALLTTPVGWIIAGMVAIGAATYELIKHWQAVKDFFVDTWDAIKAKFGWATDVIAYLLAPFIVIPAEIIGHWGAIADFFSSLWDGITGIFERAWDFIKGIVDKIVGAVKTVVEAGEDVSAIFSGKSASDLSDERSKKSGEALGDRMYDDMLARKRAAQAMSISSGMNGGVATQNAKVTIDVTGAQRGTRVTADPKSTADVDVNVGYQLATGLIW